MLKVFLNIVLSMVLGKLKEFAIKTVEGLSAETLTNEQKRDAAFNQIKSEAIVQGKSLRDSLINLSIEAALTWLRK